MTALFFLQFSYPALFKYSRTFSVNAKALTFNPMVTNSCLQHKSRFHISNFSIC